MNLIDYAVLLVLALFIAGGYYKGFLFTSISIATFLFSWIIALLFRPLIAASIINNQGLYNMMLYYTEGSEAIGNVEFAKAKLDSLSATQISEIIGNSNLPYPIGKVISKNIATEVFADKGILTLGDYYNQTMVNVFINIIAFLIMFIIVYVILRFVLNGVDYAARLPRLRRLEPLMACGVGLINGILCIFLIFMLVPIILSVLPFDFVKEYVDNSFFAPFFHRTNFLLSLIPGT